MLAVPDVVIGVLIVCLKRDESLLIFVVGIPGLEKTVEGQSAGLRAPVELVERLKTRIASFENRRQRGGQRNATLREYAPFLARFVESIVNRRNRGVPGWIHVETIIRGT